MPSIALIAITAVPKEYTIFKVEIPVAEATPDAMDVGHHPKPLVFELHGSQLARRPVERTAKATKMHIPPDI
jgi:RNase P/RNase MRP subunit p29